MTKKEQNHLYFLLFSGALYYVMLYLVPTNNGMGLYVAIAFGAPITLGTSLMAGTLYYILLKKTTYVFLTEVFSMLGVGLIALTLLSFPYL
jgi:Mn2+/Fe2+ NRAMP family transporter